MRVATKIWLLIGLTWGVGTGAGGFLMYRSQEISANYDTLIKLIGHDVRLQDSARQMQVKFKIQVQEWKDILLRGYDPGALNKHLRAFQDDENSVNEMAEALAREAPDARIRAAAEEFGQAHAEMGRRYASALDMFIRAKGLDPRGADVMVKGQDRAPTTLVDKLVELLCQSSNARISSHRQALAAQFWTVVLFMLLAFGSIGVASVLTIRTLSATLRVTANELAGAAGQMASAASQISTASQSLAQSSSEQAASLEETSASTEEINSMARRSSENSRSAASVVMQSQQKFAETEEALSKMVAAMGEIQAQSDKISRIIKVIDEIAFQTNILALNAAVEAARAGESGACFAVVADEVRNLAQRCTQAAKNTAALIEESIAKSNDGKSRMDQVAALMRAITEEAVQVKTLVDDVNLGSQEQQRGTEQVAKAIIQMEQVTQTTAASAEESAAASEELSAQAQALEGIVRRLSKMLGGEERTDLKRRYRG